MPFAAAHKTLFWASTSARRTESPAPDYEVAVFENRFPSLSGSPEPPDELIGPLPHRLRRGGRCEVVAFTSDHDATFASLGEDRVQLILAAWTDRTANLFALPGIQQVYVFENAGVVLQNAEWVAFVPFAARWPYEAHLYPRRRVPDFTGLDDAQRAAFPAAYLDLLRRFQRLFGADAPPVPYIAAWYQAPSAEPRAVALHVEVFTVRRGPSPGRLTYLAGTESGMGAFMQDIAPERAADRLRAAAAGPVPAGDLGQLPGRRVVAQRRVPLAHPGHRRALVSLRRPGRPAGQRTWATTSGR